MRQWKPPAKEESLGRCHNAFTANGKILVNASEYGPIVLWDVKTGNQLFRIQPRKEKHGLYGLAVSPDGRTLATICSNGNRIELWHVQTRKFVKITRA